MCRMRAGVHRNLADYSRFGKLLHYHVPCLMPAPPLAMPKCPSTYHHVKGLSHMPLHGMLSKLCFEVLGLPFSAGQAFFLCFYTSKTLAHNSCRPPQKVRGSSARRARS